jgi:BirA family biotin operon repressor/biotin-[acetyl-CoA-carboxylase] ligase
MPFDAELVRARFPEREFHWYASLPSTMLVAAHLAAAGAKHGTAVLADHQSAGKGRLGRSWHSEPDAGLYLSTVLRLPFSGTAFPALTLAVGLAVRDAIDEVTGLQCDLRWPNDLLLADRKCAGILLSLEGGAVVAGIGINVNHASFPMELDAEAISLRLFGMREYSREQICIAVLAAVDRYCELVSTHGVESILRLFAACSTFASGRRVVVDQSNGRVEGVTAGLDEQGFLRVRKDDGALVTILAGGVRPAPEA